ncbi:hydroxymethylglutaryl-CoA synthase family protein [Gemmatimonadota bacterium]
MRPSRPHGSLRARPQSVGIEKIWAYPGTQSLDMEELALARGHDPADIRDNLLVLSRTVNPLWEDPVTMTVNAAQPMLDDEDRASIELLIVATESSVDQGKAMSTFAQHFLGIQPNCRNFESKHACYAGTSAVMMAAHWVASGLNGDAKALVIAADQSRMSLHEPYEYVMGAGSVALLISNHPRVLAFEMEHNGFWTNHCFDTFRPTSRVETGNMEASLYCYLDALEGAYAHFQAKAGPVDFDSYFKKNIYHVPFGGMTLQAHRTLLRKGRRMKKSEAVEHFGRKSKPGLKYTSQMGGTYSCSTYLALMGMIDSCDDLVPGDRISLFSYGSGSCGEFYSGILGPEARELVAAARLQDLLDARRPMTVQEYEMTEQERFENIDNGDFVPDTCRNGSHYESHYQGKRLLTLRSISDFNRDYDWS